MDSENTDREELQMEALSTGTNGSVKDVGFWKELIYQIRLIWYLIRDPEVPIYVKIIPFVALLYALVPTDLIPDVFPVMGQLDDITALLVGGKVFIELSPPHVVQKYLVMLRQRGRSSQILEGETAVEDNDDQDALAEAIIIEGDFSEVVPEDENGSNSPEDILEEE